MEDVEAPQSVGRAKHLPQSLVLDHVSPATRLLEKRRQMFEVQEALENQKAEFNRKEEVFKKREEALKMKDLELQESLIRFSKFLQENDSKRARAEKKAADEIKARIQKEKEIEGLADQLEELRAEKERVHGVLEKNMRYQHYLESVLEGADEYQEVPDLLMRHATLRATNKDLRDHQQKCSEAAESIRAELAAYVKGRTDEILNLSNRVARLKKELEKHEGEAMVQESKKDSSLQVASQKTLEYGQVVFSTDNIFNRCHRHLGMLGQHQALELRGCLHHTTTSHIQTMLHLGTNQCQDSSKCASLIPTHTCLYMCLRTHCLWTMNTCRTCSASYILNFFVSR
ncbi:hypothetical protein DUNSADRAFT_12297 [Dunaliella salina]|uniref:DUF4200 domain-containing protein n=1 Tax=Dunaliella salina TaxID=3046 RepID=A0ABQ7H427_DUNSA|nr:hypothetical protein DUNSADRAFT_12297 [Dunaliella salina]|eukprot:KAF5841600.1 hypothetical protein DUNSADRAFT_12297 [Dunaliella salina]